MLDQRAQSQERIEVILACDDLPDNRPCASDWGSGKDEQLARIISIPEGMTMADGLRMLEGFTEAELEKISANCPAPLGPGSLFAIRR